MIETVELIEWHKLLDPRSWYKELRGKINTGEFRFPRNHFVGGVSNEVDAAARTLDECLREEEDLINLIGWINARIVDQTNTKNRFHLPHDNTYDIWLKLNGLTICLRFEDEYGGQGSFRFGGDVQYIDKAGNDETWVALFQDLVKVAKGEEFIGFDEDFEPSEYC